MYPDALVVWKEPEYFDTNEVLSLNPYLIVEVLSRSSRAHYRKEKFEAYLTADSLMEYVLIDQKKCRVETRFRVSEDTWNYKIFTDINDDVLFRSLNVSIKMDSIMKTLKISSDF